jgi:hypothetical protein
MGEKTQKRVNAESEFFLHLKAVWLDCHNGIAKCGNTGDPCVFISNDQVEVGNYDIYFFIFRNLFHIMRVWVKQRT